MTLDQAAELINQHPDLTARVVRGQIKVDVYGRDAGYVTAEELARLTHTPTGFGRYLRKGALKVWQSLQKQEG